MIELPEAVVLARQIHETIRGKEIRNVTSAQSPHKLAWYYGDITHYQELLTEKRITDATYHGGLVEIRAGSANLLFGEGVNLRYYPNGVELPQKHQLDVEFEDSSHLIASVQMYGGLGAYSEGTNENPYYLGAKAKPSPMFDSFSEAYFDELFSVSENLSLKAFLATEQRIPGLGNGVLQDILFIAKLHPKKKLSTLSDAHKETLFKAIKTILAQMVFEGGRDTERDLFSCLGGYKTYLSKTTVDKPCPICGTVIKKEAYMGGSIYVCEGCQEK